eukprot:10264473-Prorocentrum_lima.AAC.1
MTSSLVGSEMCIRDSSFVLETCGGASLETLLIVDVLQGAAPITSWVSIKTVSYTHLTLPTICSV